MKLLTTPTSHKASRTTNNVQSIALPFVQVSLLNKVRHQEKELQEFESGVWNRELLYR